MKTLRRISASAMLSLMLAVSVFAGHIETPGAPAPKTTTTSTSTSTSTTTTTTDDITTDILLTMVGVVYG